MQVTNQLAVGDSGPHGFFHDGHDMSISCTRWPWVPRGTRGLLFHRKESEMPNVKCFHCGKSFALDAELAAAWMQEHQEERPKHYSAQCHFCRRVVKVPLKQIRRYLPAQEDASPQ